MTSTGQHNAMSGQARIATVGTFDGLHRGHMVVLRTLAETAARRGLDPLIVTFAGHPLEYIAPERAPELLMDPEEKLHALGDFGEVHTEDMTTRLTETTAERWLADLRDRHGVRVLVLGYDNTFGCDGRHMSHQDYVDLGRRLGIEVITPSECPGYSSSSARKAIAAGEMEKAEDILGHPYGITGEVVEGDRIGRTIGFPTANIRPPLRRVIPPAGVYATRVTLPSGQRYPGVTDIGIRPTLGNPDPTLRIETFIPGFDGDLYGRSIRIDFLRRLRPEQKFDSLGALCEAIAGDVSRALAIYTLKDHEDNQF